MMPKPKEEPRPAELASLKLRLKELEEELAWQRRLSEAVQSIVRPTVYLASAFDYRIVSFSQVFLERYQISQKEALARTCYQITRGFERPCEMEGLACPRAESLRTGQPASAEHVLPGQDGEKIYAECRSLPLPDKDGQIRSLLQADHDISVRRRAEERLKEANRELARSNAFLRNLIMSSADAVIAADKKGKILIFNQAAGQITGYTEEEALSSLDIRDIYPPGGAKEVMAKLRSEEFGGKGKLKSVEVRLLRKDKTTVPISLSAAIVYEGGVEVGTVGFFYDLREKQRMERELDKTRVQLLQAEKMASVGKLAAGVAHQLNNPLSGITLFTKILLEEYDLEPAAREDLKRILDNAERCRMTVRELLQFARQTSGEMRPADVNEALTRTLFLLEKQSLFHNIEIITDFHPTLPRVVSDIQQLSQAFMNIILNAADAMAGKGKIRVATSLGPEKKSVIIEFADTGPGIPEEILPYIFEPFFTTKEEGKGTGLGLSVAYGIIENHHGRISAHNHPQGGACFVIELPIESSPQGGAVHAQGRPAGPDPGD